MIVYYVSRKGPDQAESCMVLGGKEEERSVSLIYGKRVGLRVCVRCLLMLTSLLPRHAHLAGVSCYGSNCGEV